MKVLDAADAARSAPAANPKKPATMVAFDSADARVVLFRVEPGQSVAPHTSVSTVLLFVISGSGIVTGAEGDRHVKANDVVSYAPSERHGFHATTERLIVAAVITPRPGTSAR